MNKPVVDTSFLFPTRQDDPFALYRDLRRDAPVAWSSEMGCFVVSTHELILQVIADTQTYSSRGTQDVIVNDAARDRILAIRASGHPTVPFLATNDPPEHGKYRKLVSQLFNPRRMRAMQGGIDRLVGNLLDGFLAKRGGDFMADFAMPLPVMVIAELLGVPVEEWRTYRAWGDAYVAPMNGVISVEREIECAELLREYQEYFVAQIEARRSRPRDDLITELATVEIPGEGRTMDIPEMLSAIQQFLVAGGETTTYSLGSGMLLLATRPDLADALRADPDKVPPFVEEMLRLRSPTQGVIRLTTRDTQLAGVDIPKGSFVNIRLASANRDETLFAHPDSLDLERRNAMRHIAFGSGIHTCMGAQLARMELATSFRHILDRTTFVLDEQAGGFQWFESSFFMGLAHLRLRMEGRA